MKASELMASAPAPAEPVLVYTGPTRTGTALIAAVAADADQQATPKARGKKSRVAKKQDAGSDTKPEWQNGGGKAGYCEARGQERGQERGQAGSDQARCGQARRKAGRERRSARQARQAQGGHQACAQAGAQQQLG